MLFDGIIKTKDIAPVGDIKLGPKKAKPKWCKICMRKHSKADKCELTLVKDLTRKLKKPHQVVRLDEKGNLEIVTVTDGAKVGLYTTNKSGETSVRRDRGKGRRRGNRWRKGSKARKDGLDPVGSDRQGS